MRRNAAVLAAVAAMAAISAAPASANISVAPSSHDFGAQQVATVSASTTFTLKVTCYPDPANPPNGCTSNHPFTPNVTTGPGFPLQDNGCTSPMPGDTTFGTTCQFEVAFAPIVPGFQQVTGSVGDPGGFGQFLLEGTGTVLPPPPPPSSPAGTASTGASAPSTTKKCKRKRRAAAAKKCRRKK